MIMLNKQPLIHTTGLSKVVLYNCLHNRIQVLYAPYKHYVSYLAMEKSMSQTDLLLFFSL